MINGKKIGAHYYTKRRWHIILAFKWFVHNGMECPPPNSKKADAYAKKIIDVLNSEDKSYVHIFERCQHLIDTIGEPTDDELKRARFTGELFKAVEAEINK